MRAGVLKTATQRLLIPHSATALLEKCDQFKIFSFSFSLGVPFVFILELPF